MARILILCNKMPYPPNDGGAIATLNMLYGLSEHDNELHVLAMQTYKHQFPIEQIPVEYSSKIKWYSVWIDTRFNLLSMFVNLLFSKKPYNARRFESDKFYAKLNALLTKNTFDIIQLEGLYLAPYIKSIRQNSNALVVLRAHNVENEIWKRLSDNETSIFKKIYKKILWHRIKKMENSTLGQIDLLVPITQRDATQLLFADSTKVMVSSTGIMTGKFKEINTPVKKNSLFYIGALDWEPNQEAILWFIEKVWIYIKIEYPEWDFYIAGRNAPRFFTDKLKTLPVIYCGQVDDAGAFIDEHNINVVPLLSGSGMRIKIIEAMARSRCIVTTSIGAEGIGAVDGKDLFIANTPGTFKTIIEDLIKHNDKIDETARNAFKFARENFDNTLTTGKLNNFYNQWLSNR
jgi:polysaccharide biosynthesis protein PslH